MTAFALTSLDRLSNQPNSNVNSIWGYTDTTSTLATLTASGYFNAANTGTSTTNPRIKVNDQIMIVGSNGMSLVYVTAISPNVTVGALIGTIPSASVTKAMLASTITPSHIIVYSSTITTTGGDATEGITVTGAQTTDLALCFLKTAGSTPRTILSASVSSTNTLTSIWSGDPSNDHVYVYQIWRATS